MMVGQASVPLVGLVDCLVIGRTGDAAALAGVALGVALIDMVFWSFGFLRMGLSGLVAQARGAGDTREVDALLIRGLVLGLAIGLVLLWATRRRPECRSRSSPDPAARFATRPPRCRSRTTSNAPWRSTLLAVPRTRRECPK